MAGRLRDRRWYPGRAAVPSQETTAGSTDGGGMAEPLPQISVSNHAVGMRLRRRSGRTVSINA